MVITMYYNIMMLIFLSVGMCQGMSARMLMPWLYAHEMLQELESVKPLYIHYYDITNIGRQHYYLQNPDNNEHLTAVAACHYAYYCIQECVLYPVAQVLKRYLFDGGCFKQWLHELTPVAYHKSTMEPYIYLDRLVESSISKIAKGYCVRSWQELQEFLACCVSVNEDTKMHSRARRMYRNFLHGKPFIMLLRYCPDSPWSDGYGISLNQCTINLLVVENLRDCFNLHVIAPLAVQNLELLHQLPFVFINTILKNEVY